MSKISVYTLGTAIIDAGPTRVTPSSNLSFALLLYLSADPGRPAPRETLQELIYPDKSDQLARHCLRDLTYRLRQAGIPIETDLDGIGLPAKAVSSDYTRLILADRPNVEQIKAAEGGFLPGYAPDHSEAFSEWFDGFRARVTFALCNALLKEVARARGAGDWLATDRASRACLGLDALNEEATLALAEALAMSGAKALAVKLLDRFMSDVGSGSHDLRVSAAVLRRRIGECVAEPYRTRPSSPFVGRDAEMLALRERLSLARGGTSQCVVLVGETGIGKSRLAAEFCIAAALEGAQVAPAASQPNDAHRPFGAFADLMPRLLQMRGALGCAPASMRAIERLARARTGGDALPVSDAVRDSDALCDSIARAIVDVVDAVASEQTVIITLEDIQWLDAMSIRVIDTLASARRERRLFLLLTSRAIGRSRELDAACELSLDRLGDQAIERMIDAFGGKSGQALDADLRSWLESASAGNPLYLESLIDHFVRTGERFSIPADLSALIARRLDPLPPNAATTLQLCALLGKHSTLDTITAAVQLPRFELLVAVAELEAARLIKGDRDRIQPAHALIADVALRTMTPVQERLAHQCIAVALEDRAARDCSTALLWDCAHHWLAAHNDGRALIALRRCAVRALEIGRPAEAAEMLEKGLTLDIPPDVRLEIAHELVLAGDAAGDPVHVVRGVEILKAKPGAAQHDDVEFAELRALALTAVGAADHVARIFPCIEAHDAPPNHRVAAATLALKYADVHADAELQARAVATLSDDVVCAADELVRLEFLLIRSTMRAEWDEAATIARALIVASQPAPTPTRLALQGNAFVALDRSGMTSEAIDAAKSVYADAESAGLHRRSVRAALALSEFRLDLGDDADAAEWFERAERIADAVPGIADDFNFVIPALGRACALADAKTARRIFNRAKSMGVFEGSTPRSRHRRVFDTAVRQMNGGAPVSEEQIGSLLSGAKSRSSYTGLRDGEAATACRALAARGQYREARSVFDDYTSVWRSARSPLARCLQNVGLERVRWPA